VLVGAAADLHGTNRDEALRFMGDFAARSHGEFYGDLLRGSGSSSRVFALWSTQFDAGKMQRTSEGPGRARVELQEFASPSRELCLLIGGYIRGTLGINEVEDIVVEELSCTTRGDAACAWRASWKRDADEG
jgi:predicted hydrocarbon binding protein